MTTKDTMECHKKAIAKSHNGAKFYVQREKFVVFYHIFRRVFKMGIISKLLFFSIVSNYPPFLIHFGKVNIKISEDLLLTISYVYGRENQICDGLWNNIYKRLSFFADRYNGLNRKRKGPFNQESQGACPGAVTNGISTVNGNNSSESQVLALPKNGNNNTNNMWVAYSKWFHLTLTQLLISTIFNLNCFVTLTKGLYITSESVKFIMTFIWIQYMDAVIV